MTAAKPPNDARAEGVDYYLLPGADLRMFRCASLSATLSTKGCAERWCASQVARGIADLAADAATGLLEAKERVKSHTHGRKQANAQAFLGIARDRIRAVTAQAESYDACRRCSIGAVHAGRKPITISRHYQTDRCPRCAMGTTRMIGGRVCVSCYNREREVVAGRNGRGHKPRELAPVATIPATYTLDGWLHPQRPHTVAVAHVAKVTVGRERAKAGKQGKRITANVERGGVAELILQTLRHAKGVVDFHPIAERPHVALQREFAW